MSIMPFVSVNHALWSVIAFNCKGKCWFPDQVPQSIIKENNGTVLKNDLLSKIVLQLHATEV